MVDAAGADQDAGVLQLPEDPCLVLPGLCVRRELGEEEDAGVGRDVLDPPSLEERREETVRLREAARVERDEVGQTRGREQSGGGHGAERRGLRVAGQRDAAHERRVVLRDHYPLRLGASGACAGVQPSPATRDRTEWRVPKGCIGDRNTNHANAAGPKVFAGAPHDMHARRMASDRLRIQVERGHKRRRTREVGRREDGQSVHLVGDEVDVAVLAEAHARLDDGARVALADGVVRVGQNDGLDGRVGRVDGAGQGRDQGGAVGQGMPQAVYVDQHRLDLRPHAEHEIEAI